MPATRVMAAAPAVRAIDDGEVLIYAVRGGSVSRHGRSPAGWKRMWRSGVLAAGNFPAHRTIREFRQLHQTEFAALFVQVVQLAREAGLVTLGRVGIDGTKVKPMPASTRR